MALAHELLSLQGGPSCAYYLALAQTYLLKEDFSKCKECLCEAVRTDYMVILLCVPRGAARCPKAGHYPNTAADPACVVTVCEPKACVSFPLEEFSC